MVWNHFSAFGFFCTLSFSDRWKKMKSSASSVNNEKIFLTFFSFFASFFFSFLSFSSLYSLPLLNVFFFHLHPITLPVMPVVPVSGAQFLEWEWLTCWWFLWNEVLNHRRLPKKKISFNSDHSIKWIYYFVLYLWVRKIPLMRLTNSNFCYISLLQALSYCQV